MSSVSSAPSASPSSRLRLAVPVVSHVQIDSSDFSRLLAEAGPGALTGDFAPTTVLDVRGADYAGGHIRGSVHVAFDALESASASPYDSLVARAQAASTSKLVVLDLSSKQQAPVVAETFLAKFKDTHAALEQPTVYVVTLGFAGVLNDNVNISPDRATITLKQDATNLIEDFNAAAWVAVAVPRTPSRLDLPNSSNMCAANTRTRAARPTADLLGSLVVCSYPHTLSVLSVVSLCCVLGWCTRTPWSQLKPSECPRRAATTTKR